MSATLLKSLSFVILLAACTATSRNSKQAVDNNIVADETTQPAISNEQTPLPLTDLPQTQYGGFVLKPGFYEAEFKTYCLQPGTPDPSPRDAYLQSAVTGYRKEIVEDILVNSRMKTDLDQKNVQLLLWSVVSGSDFNKLSPAVKADAARLLTPRQIFELQGGVLGVIKTVSYSTGILNSNKELQRLFEMSASYERLERIAVLREPSQVKRTGVKADKWYKQSEKYYVRYLPVNYKKVRIQVYVPDSLLDAEGKLNGEYVVFDPTGRQAIPAFTNAQRLGVGGPVNDIVKVIIQVGKQHGPRRDSEPVRRPKNAAGKPVLQ